MAGFPLSLDVLIEGRLGSLGIGNQPEEAYSKGKDTEEEPAGKTEIKIEQVVLVTLHHLAAEVYGR